jgi:hypothetical protein
MPDVAYQNKAELEIKYVITIFPFTNKRHYLQKPNWCIVPAIVTQVF